MSTYKHTQRGTLIIVAMAIISVVIIAMGATLFRPMLVAVPIFVVCAWLFHSLTVEINNGELRWRFGPGLIRKQIRLEDIVKAQPVRTNVIEGWGIHLSRFGWLYNVSGFDAVAITLQNGRRFALGTDEPSVLAALLKGPLSNP